MLSSAPDKIQDEFIRALYSGAAVKPSADWAPAPLAVSFGGMAAAHWSRGGTRFGNGISNGIK